MCESEWIYERGGPGLGGGGVAGTHILYIIC